MTSSIFITGAASGIGRATAIRFAREGWRVGAFDVDTAGLERLQGELPPDLCLTGRLDVTHPEGYAETIRAFSDWTEGRMDVLFNNAGILFQGFFEAVPLDAQLRTIDVNLKGVVIGIHSALPLLKATPGSRILSMCSASAVYGSPDHSVYSATKFGVRALTEALSLELKPRGIRVVDLMPSFVATPMLSEQTNPSGLMNALGVDHAPEEIADWAWKAVHEDRLHWMTRRVKMTELIATLFPGIARRSLERLLEKPTAPKEPRR